MGLNYKIHNTKLCYCKLTLFLYLMIKGLCLYVEVSTFIFNK